MTRPRGWQSARAAIGAARLCGAIVLLTGVVLSACAPPEPPVSAAEYDATRPLNPKSEGKTVYRSFGGHHPTCFVFVGKDERGGDTTEIDCPAGAASQLESCPAGKLYTRAAHTKAAGTSCVCVPIDGDASRVACGH